MYGINTNEYSASAIDSEIFSAANDSGSGQVLCQVSFLDGAAGSVSIKASLGLPHTFVDQGDVISSDSIIRLAYCPQLRADVQFQEGSTGRIVVSTFSV